MAETKSQEISAFGAVAGLAASIVGAGVGFAGSINKGRAIRASARFERTQIGLEMARAEFHARDVTRRGAIAANEHMARVRGLIGAQRAALAGQNVDIATGSAAQVIAQTEALGEVDAATIRNNAFRQAFGYKSQIIGLTAKARAVRAGANLEERMTVLTGGLKFVKDLGIGYAGFEELGGPEKFRRAFGGAPTPSAYAPSGYKPSTPRGVITDEG